MTIKCIRLATGEDIIGDVEDKALENDPTIIKNPAQIVLQQGEGGKVGAAFVPFLPFAKDNVVRYYSNGVIGECEIDMNLKNEYNRIFGSGIVVATANQLPK